MFNYKVKHLKLISCLIILVITGFLGNSSMFYIMAYDDDRTIDQKRLSTARSIHSQSFVENQYIDHDPINIGSDSDFSDLGFPGSGTNDDPFIISGYSISNPYGNVIEITNSDSYFVIRNNKLNNSIPEWGSGITLINTNHGTIENNIISECFNGIWLYYAEYTLILKTILI